MERSKSKVMPHSIEAEEALLGCIISDSFIAAELISDLKEEDFYSETLKIVFSALNKIYKANKVVDLVTLSDELEKEGNMEKIGGIDYIAKLTTIVPSTANANHYLEIVKESSLRRRLIRSSENIIDKALDGDNEKDPLAFAEKAIFDISSGNEKRFPEEIASSLDKVVEKLGKVAKDPSSTKGLTTGFESLDNMLNGLQKSDLIILAARPAEGKTSLAMNIVESAAIEGRGVCLVFSLEMSKTQLAQRMLCSRARVSMEKALKGKLNMSDWERLWATKEELDNAKILIDDTAAAKPADMLSKARRVKSKYGRLDLIMVDYIQLMTTDSRTRSDNRQNEVSDISRNLKLIAKEIDCPVIALSQLSRLIENRNPPRPQLSDLRESGAIEQDADIVMFIYNPNAQNGKTGANNFTGSGNSGIKEIIVAKHRNGPCGEIPVRWIGEYVRYEDAGIMPEYATNRQNEESADNVAYYDSEVAVDEQIYGDVMQDFGGYPELE